MAGKLSFGDFYTIVWNLVPSVWRDTDEVYGKSLQIVLYTMAQHMYYYFYSKIVHMEELFDPDRCPEKYLRFLAGMVGWTLQGSDPISWREQIKAAPLLYKIKGTKRGLLLAEKLVGYSVFMSELYRDHIGDTVSKEKIFNNTPDSIKVKPWFRKHLTNLEGEKLPGFAESDQFDSFNITNMVKLNPFGEVIRPRVLTNSRKLAFTPSSTTSRYVNTTGKYSLARYAKLPRINVVLRYNDDLDTENLDGTIKNNNFSSALDLLLQFKPFHVKIENLEVRYDISEFIFDQTTIDSDFFNVQDGLEAAILMSSTRAENTITYGGPTPVDSVVSDDIPATSLDNRGVISSIYQTIDLSLLTPEKESSLFNLSKLNLPIKSFEPNNKTAKIASAANGNNIYTLDDFIIYSSEQYQLIFDAATSTITSFSSNFSASNYAPGSTLKITGTLLNNTTYTVVAQPLPSTIPANNFIYLSTPPVNETVLAGTIDIIQNPFYTTDTIKEYLVPSDKFSNVPGYVYNPGHTALRYNLSTFLVNPILDFKTMFSTQQGNIDFTEVPAPHVYIELYGGIASFVDNKMTLIQAPINTSTSIITNVDPAGISIAIGQFVLSDKITPKTRILSLFSGALNAPGSVYILSNSVSAPLPVSPIVLVAEDTSQKLQATNYVPGLDSSNITNITVNTQPFRSLVDVKTYTTCGGAASFSGFVMTLLVAPIVGEIAVGQTLLTNGLSNTTTISSLLSGTINVSGSTYQLSNSVGDTPLSAQSIVTESHSIFFDDLQSITSPLSRPWELQKVQEFITNTGISFTNTDVFKYVYDHSCMVVLEVPSPEEYILLTPNVDYYFDNTNDIHINSASIASNISPTPGSYNFLLSCKLHLLYLSRTTYDNETEEGLPIRGFRYTTRKNSKFTRQFLINTIKQPTLASIMPTEIVSIDGKTKQKTVLGTKVFKTSSNIYNRSSLKNQVVNGYNVVSRNELNRIDSSKWLVYSPEYTSNYLGDQFITNNWWGNYYGANSINEQQIAYSYIDRSETAQTQDANSDQWMAALEGYNPSDPSQFLVSRTINPNRTTLWNRSSANFVSVPYSQSKRDVLQLSRSDIPTFNRSETSSDYLTDTSAPPKSDNYKYILSDGTDVSSVYFSPDFPDSVLTSPTLESGTGQKATLVNLGTVASFANNIMTLITIPTSGSIAIGQIITAVYVIGEDNSILNGTKILKLLTGNLSEVGSTYLLSKSFTALNNKKIITSSDGYNLLFQKTSDIYYDNASSNVNPEVYFRHVGLNKYNIKPSLYASNIPINLDPTTATVITEALDKFNVEITGITPEVDIFTITDPTITTYFLSDNNIWVSWMGTDTGEVVSYGYYSASAYLPNIFPNVKLFLNGILTQYGTDWMFGYDTAQKSVVLLTFIDINDIIRVEYEISTSQVEILDLLPPPTYPYNISYTLILDDINYIHLGNRYSIELPSKTVGSDIIFPCVSWYSSSSAYISSSSDPKNYQPTSLYDEATPNISVFLNGILLDYKRDWFFLLKATGSVITPFIVLSPLVSLSLDLGDTVHIDYFSTV